MTSTSDRIAAITEVPAAKVRVYWGTVTAYREDGSVNVSIAGQQYLACPCSDSYTNRNKGDRVRVVSAGKTQYVMGRIGPDPDALIPNVAVQDSEGYTAATGTFVSNSPNQAGCSGVAPDIAPLINAWGYYNGTTNLLTTAAKTTGKTFAVLILTRLATAHGDPGPQQFEVWPHNYDALPIGSVAMRDTFVPATGFTPLTGSLELGEQAEIDIPADWFAGMKATTPTVRGVCVTPSTLDSDTSLYVRFSASAGQLLIS
jgi:hypothetical protein